MTVSGQSHASSHTQSYNQKRLPTRPPPQTVHSSGIPPRSSASSAPPQHAYAAAPSRFEHHHPHSHPHSHSHSGRSSSANGPPGQSLSQPQTQSRHHPLHPSPPPQNYGFGPPPVHPQRNRPPPSSRPPPSPAPPPLTAPSDDPQQLFPLFRAANASHSGALTEGELGSALVNGDYTSFHPRTVRLMIRMFDRDGNGTINFDEFVSLWRYLAAWRELFDRFDEDRSGRVSQPEFEKALVAFGYRLSGKFISVIFGVFEGKAKQMSHAPKDSRLPGMGFDLFVQACISLKRMTDVFKRYDDDRDGYITLSFEEALTEILLLQE
ncbi:Calcium binding modulator protein (Alg2), putative [Penicillium digitatum PHI26]|uniref:Calcium binding modulator protein (Alg2), putative n=3 Tax=Penicillium digitatum TaxID=36651 RepID=K9GXD2_PEND2|nr:Calcium binding modulator protein (Alg2), putative [Penicillium digitatum Pd1]EKV19263.1 Calcium binding modulator protein (Alg2), putative [Penicillium digitatum PHI26]EKV21223.1 Calcium binding modulator protein (Alg2), putative [Penicillium digitatum Pd1]